MNGQDKASDYNPLISIITPTYNHEDYIAECIESVLCQTYTNWEMIIVDDASTDKTPFIVEEYAKKDSRIKFIRNKKNNGPLYLDINYNLALKGAKGEWIGYLEGDDVFVPKALEYRVNALRNISEKERDNIALVHGRHGRIWMDKKVIDTLIFSYHKDKKYFNIINNKPIGQSLLLFLQGINFIAAASVLINRKKIENIGGFRQDIREIRAADFPTWIYLALEGEFLFVPKIIYFWRLHSKSITMNFWIEMVKNAIEVVNLFWLKHKDLIVNKLGLINFDNCVGALAKLILATLYAKNMDHKKALELIKQAKTCPYIGDFLHPIKLFIFNILIKLRLPFPLINKFSFLKSQAVDIKKIGKYKPFFFKEIRNID